MKSPTFDEYAALNWEAIQPYYGQLLDVELTPESIDSWMKSWSELRKLVDERYARLSLATNLDTSDDQAEKSYHDFLEIIYPEVQAADQKLKEKILESQLVPVGMELALRKMSIEAELFREENLPLLTKESKLSTEYNKIISAQTVEWEREELTLGQVKTTMLTEDRGLRKRLWN